MAPHGDIRELADKFEIDGEEAEMREALHQREGKKKAKKKKERRLKLGLADSVEVVSEGSEAISTGEDVATAKEGRGAKTRDVDALNVKVQTENERDVAGLHENDHIQIGTEGSGNRTDDKVNDEFVGYDGILEDLRIASFLDKHLTDKELDRSDEVMERLRKKFPKLPKLSQKEGTQEDLNRQKLRAVYEYMSGGEMSHYAKDFFNTKEEAVKYLKKLEVGGVAEVFSVDWKEKMASDPLLQALIKEANLEKWAEKLESWESMPEKARETEILALRGLMKIRGMETRTYEFRNVWEVHKGRLRDLGLVV